MYDVGPVFGRNHCRPLARREESHWFISSSGFPGTGSSDLSFCCRGAPAVLSTIVALCSLSAHLLPGFSFSAWWKDLRRALPPPPPPPHTRLTLDANHASFLFSWPVSHIYLFKWLVRINPVHAPVCTSLCQTGQFNLPLICRENISVACSPTFLSSRFAAVRVGESSTRPIEGDVIIIIIIIMIIITVQLFFQGQHTSVGLTGVTLGGSGGRVHFNVKNPAPFYFFLSYFWWMSQQKQQRENLWSNAGAFPAVITDSGGTILSRSSAGAQAGFGKSHNPSVIPKALARPPQPPPPWFPHKGIHRSRSQMDFDSW